MSTGVDRACRELLRETSHQTSRNHRAGAAKSLDPCMLMAVVYEAEDGDDEGAKIHKKKTSAMSGAIGSTPRVGRSSALLKSSKKLAHGVS